MRRVWLLLIVLVMSGGAASAQTVAISSFEKLSSNFPFIRLIGKNNMGILVHRYGKKTDLITAYDDDLRVKWKKTIEFKQPDADVIKCIAQPGSLLVFYTIGYKDRQLLYVRRADGELSFAEPPVLIDTVDQYKDEKIRVIHAKNNGLFLCYRVYQDKNGQDHAFWGLLNDDLDVLAKRKVDFPEQSFPTELEEVLLSNDGDVCFLFKEDSKTKRREFKQNSFIGHLFNRGQGAMQTVTLSDQDKFLKDVAMDFDNVNRRLVLAGFYADIDAEIATGYFYHSLSLDTLDRINRSFTAFDPTLIDRLTGRKKDQKINGLSTFRVKELILRQDGGGILITESVFTTTETRTAPGFSPSMFYSTVTYSYYHYNDILLFSIHPDGSTHWDKIIRKRQFSEGDDGFYSSFLLSFNKSKMHLIFNEEVNFNTKVFDYAISGSGEEERNDLMANISEDVLLIPKLGKQIAHNELIIPSIFRNKLRLVKITF